VVARVHHNALGAHAGAGHHRRRYPCPYVPTETYYSKRHLSQACCCSAIFLWLLGRGVILSKHNLDKGVNDVIFVMKMRQFNTFSSSVV
jgi:hypothetical protein